MNYSSYTATPATAPVIERTPVDGGESALYLAEVKNELGIDLTNTDYDDALDLLISVAIEAVEGYTRYAVQPTLTVVRYGAYDGAPLPYGPVWQVDPPPVVVGSDTGSSITFSNSTSDAVGEGDHPGIGTGFTAGSVTYTAGYSRLPELGRPVPALLVGAVVCHAATTFRTGGITGGKPGSDWKVIAGPKRRFD